MQSRTPSKGEALRESPIVVKTCGAKHTTYQPYSCRSKSEEMHSYGADSAVILQREAGHDPEEMHAYGNDLAAILQREMGDDPKERHSYRVDSVMISQVEKWS